MGHALFDPNSGWFIVPGFASAAVLAVLWQIWVQFLPLRVTVPQGSFGLVTLQPRMTRTQDVVPDGEPGVQAATLPPGTYWIRSRRRRIDVYKCLFIDKDELGVVILHDKEGTSLASLNNTADYKPELGDFTDLAAVLAAGGQPGVQMAVLPPGEYTLHPIAFEVVVITPANEDNRLYGRDTRATDILFEFGPYTVKTEHGTAIVIRPHSASDSLVLRSVGAGGYEIARYVVAVPGHINITWEALVPVGISGAREQVFTGLRQRVEARFGHAHTMCGATDLAARIAAIEQDRGHKTAWIVEAVMLPLVHATPSTTKHDAVSTTV